MSSFAEFQRRPGQLTVGQLRCLISGIPGDYVIDLSVPRQRVGLVNEVPGYNIYEVPQEVEIDNEHRSLTIRSLSD